MHCTRLRAATESPTLAVAQYEALSLRRAPPLDSHQIPWIAIQITRVSELTMKPKTGLEIRTNTQENNHQFMPLRARARSAENTERVNVKRVALKV